MNDFAVATQPETVRIERTLPGPVERVWSYLTDSKKRATWFAGGEFELRAGGKAELRFDHANLSAEKVAPEKYGNMKGFVMESAIVQCDPPRLLVFTMKMGEDTTEVTFELAPRGKDTHLIVTHRRLGNRDRMVNVSAGWDAHLGILEDQLKGVEPRGFWSTHARLEREYAARIT